MARVVSPNDVYFAYEPWASHKPASIFRIQNTLMNDPPTAWLPLMNMVKERWNAFHWNPYVGGGIPGFGSSASAVLSPFIFLPSMIVPLTWIYTAIIILKINIAFWFAYAWLREEGMGKHAAAAGAIVIAAAGVYSIRWLWQITNATALYPALLWIVCRAFNGKRTPVWVMTLIAAAYALSGFPSAMAYGVYLAIAYAIFLGFRERRLPAMRVGEALAAALLAFLITAPSLVPFAQFLQRSGYLPTRATTSAVHFPKDHWQSFLDPQRLGNPVLKNWKGQPSLGPLNNYVEATIYVGALTLPLVLLALFNRRQRHRWFWVGAAAVICLCMFGVTPLGRFIGAWPGFKYTSLARMSLMLPIPAGFLAASGIGLVRRAFRNRGRAVGRFLAVAAAVALAWDLGIFAATFHPYLEPHETQVPATAVTNFLQRQEQPYRFVAFLTYMWPNSAEMYGLQDVASHFGSEAAYRRILTRIDPESWAGTSTVIQFDSRHFKFADPLVSMLGVRYFLEHKTIDILKWTTFGATTPGVRQIEDGFLLSPGMVAQRTVAVDVDPFWAIEIPVNVDRAVGASPRLDIELVKNGSVVWARTFAPADVAAMNKVYVPLRPYARLGETVTLRLWASGMRFALLRADAPAGEAPIFYGRVGTPLIFDRELQDGRLFRNLAEVPRFHAVRRVRKLNAEEFFWATNLDFSEESVITDDPIFPPEGLAADGRADLIHYEPGQQRIKTTSSGPLFLASSEKLTPELRITIDGRRTRPIEINTMFAGVSVPKGEHEVVFSRRIARGWWVPSLMGVVIFLGIAVYELTRRRRSAGAPLTAGGRRG